MKNLNRRFTKARKVIAVYFIIIILTSCSSIKENKNINVNNKLPEYKNDLYALSISGTAMATINDESNSLPFSMKIYKRDTLSMTLSGPFGVTFGKLFATRDNFLFYNIFENSAITGKPVADNLAKIINVPISFSDLISFTRNETPSTTNSFHFLKEEIDLDGKVFISNSDTTVIEYAVVSNKTGYLTNYQKKKKDGTVIVNVIYKDFQTVENYNIPKKIIIQFPIINAVLNLDYGSVKINQNFDKPLFFTLPNGVKPIKL